MRCFIRSPRRRAGESFDASAHTSLPVSISPMWRWGRLETGAAQHYQAVGERLVAERTAQASVNGAPHFPITDPRRLSATSASEGATAIGRRELQAPPCLPRQPVTRNGYAADSVSSSALQSDLIFSQISGFRQWFRSRHRHCDKIPFVGEAFVAGSGIATSPRLPKTTISIVS